MAACTNNKDVFLCILRHCVREGHLQYLQKLQDDLAGDDDIEPEDAASRAEDLVNSAYGILCRKLFSLVEKNYQNLMVSAHTIKCNR